MAQIGIYVDSFKNNPNKLKKITDDLHQQGHKIVLITSDISSTKDFIEKYNIDYDDITTKKPYTVVAFISNDDTMISVNQNKPWSLAIKHKILNIINKKRNPVLCFDLDGTILEHKFPDIGKPIKPNIDFLNKIKDKATIVIFTARINPDSGWTREKVSKYLEENDVPFDIITSDLNNIKFDAIIDDRGVSTVNDINKFINKKASTDSNIVVILRGVPGSGKSTLASKFKNAVIISADKFFTSDSGEYKFDKDRINQAHKKAFDEFKKALEDNKDLIIVDNTNIKKKDFQPYIDTATKYGYKIIIVEFEPKDVEYHYKKNIHNVPKEKIIKFIEDFEPYESKQIKILKSDDPDILERELKKELNSPIKRALSELVPLKSFRDFGEMYPWEQLNFINETAPEELSGNLFDISSDDFVRFNLIKKLNCPYTARKLFLNTPYKGIRKQLFPIMINEPEVIFDLIDTKKEDDEFFEDLFESIAPQYSDNIVLHAYNAKLDKELIMTHKDLLNNINLRAILFALDPTPNNSFVLDLAEAYKKGGNNSKYFSDLDYAKKLRSALVTYIKFPDSFKNKINKDDILDLDSFIKKIDDMKKEISNSPIPPENITLINTFDKLEKGHIWKLYKVNQEKTSKIKFYLYKIAALSDTYLITRDNNPIILVQGNSITYYPDYNATYEFILRKILKNIYKEETKVNVPEQKEEPEEESKNIKEYFLSDITDKTKQMEIVRDYSDDDNISYFYWANYDKLDPKIQAYALAKALNTGKGIYSILYKSSEVKGDHILNHELIKILHKYTPENDMEEKALANLLYECPDLNINTILLAIRKASFKYLLWAIKDYIPKLIPLLPDDKLKELYEYGDKFGPISLKVAYKVGKFLDILFPKLKFENIKKDKEARKIYEELKSKYSATLKATINYIIHKYLEV